MKLRLWIDQHPSKDRARIREELAAWLSFSEVYVRKIISGERNAPPTSVLRMAEYTGYQVTPHEIRPDLYPQESDGVPMDVYRPGNVGVA
jgi:DNA-binding transcriptional regulator YdaS (Cro superfamily)